ncbi:WD40/YVTN/BNR-like repeat-containing protein [Piscinibacter sakaiensis]|uniref:WD40/YVTN/BNR-like repeat-containing protein n=1 Tax=Piscinibacter sakaiensis TaxID=1547922 RepID=UPI003AAE5965
MVALSFRNQPRPPDERGPATGLAQQNHPHRTAPRRAVIADPASPGRTNDGDLMFRPALAFALTIAAAVAMAIAAPTEPAAIDVLDAPALKSPLAPQALINGLALAGARVVAVGQRGHVLLSDDQGKSWRQASVPSSSDLVAVTFPSPQQGWAVGHDGVVLRSDDAGVSWTRVLDGKSAAALMLDHYKRTADDMADVKLAEAMVAESERFAAQGAENPFLDIAFEDANNGWLVGAFGLIFRTTDGGASWQPMLHAADNPRALHLYAVRAVGGEVYIAGEQGLLLKLDRTAAGGGRLRALELPYKGTLFGITGNTQALLVHGLRGTVLRSTDAGSNWQAVPTGLQVGLTGSSVGSDGRIVIVSQAGHVLVSDNDGASFRPATIERPMPAAAVVAAGKHTVLVGGPRGLAVQTLPQALQ